VKGKPDKEREMQVTFKNDYRYTAVTLRVKKSGRISRWQVKRAQYVLNYSAKPAYLLNGFLGEHGPNPRYYVLVSGEIQLIDGER
jgi:hypothetical protein